jgi:CBS domain-containing protein
MLENKIGSVLIIEDEKLVGIFSERDVVNRIGIECDSLRKQPISDFMTPSPGTLEAGNKIIFAVHKMAIGGYRHVPIVEGDRPVGVISIRDILRYAEEQIGAPGT